MALERQRRVLLKAGRAVSRSGAWGQSRKRRLCEQGMGEAG